MKGYDILRCEGSEEGSPFFRGDFKDCEFCVIASFYHPAMNEPEQVMTYFDGQEQKRDIAHQVVETMLSMAPQHAAVRGVIIYNDTLDGKSRVRDLLPLLDAPLQHRLFEEANYRTTSDVDMDRLVNQEVGLYEMLT